MSWDCAENRYRSAAPTMIDLFSWIKKLFTRRFKGVGTSFFLDYCGKTEFFLALF